jgi:TonB family protein
MKLGLLSLSLAACATAGTPMDTREPATRANVQVDLSTTAPERAVFPALQSPKLPSVDRIANQILRDQVVAEIDLCVAPDGHVTNVSLSRGSGIEQFDSALLHDAGEWQFASLPGRTMRGLQTCKRATVKYQTP